MKTLEKILLLILAFLPLFTIQAQKNSSFTAIREIEQGFRNIPDSVQLAVYWYWISDNISKDGVIKDLHAMKEVGINRAFIGNIGIDGIPFGDIKIFTQEWWEIMHTALKTASELNIEIGIFNSPGWSQSGGPWVKPDEAMRYLASAELEIEGPGRRMIRLPSVGNEAQDVRVIAYPASKEKAYEKKWNLNKEDGRDLTADLQLDKEVIIRSLVFRVNEQIRTSAELWVKEKGELKRVKEILIDRSNPALNVGFDPYAPVVISLPETQAKDFRLIIKPEGKGNIEVTLSEKPLVERYAEKSLAKMHPTPLPMWHDYMWDAQPEVTDNEWTVKPDEMIDLTGQMNKEGILDWNIPSGKWIIYRFAMLPTGVTNSPATPEGTGLEVDKMSKRHAAAHFDAFIGEILRRIPADDRKTFKVVVQDSYETGGQNWTDDMLEVFEEQYGYSPIPYIPVLNGVVVGSRDLSDRFLWDLRRLVADRVAYDYVGGLREESHKHGLTTWLENYGHWGFPGEFLQYGGQSDEIGGEFWSEGSLGDIENRAASSCGHIYGKNKIWAESCTSGGPVFSRYPYVMKQRVDRFFTEGINATLLHLYIQQPYDDKEPGMAAWFGNEFNRKNVWFRQMDIFFNYLKRCNFMLQQGRYVADVAYYIGEDAPKMTGVCNPDLPYGYSFDYINAEVLLKYSSVRDRKLILDSGMEYRVLVLPAQETMRSEVLTRLKELVDLGLVVLGPAPMRSPSLAGYPEADMRVKAQASEIWENVYPAGTSLDKVLSDLRVVPDLTLQDADSSVLFIHRTLQDADIYFISNPYEKQIRVRPEFRIQGKQPELWNPQTAELRQLPEYENTITGTRVPLTLEPLESAFIVFRQPPVSEQAFSDNYPTRKVVQAIDGPWTVSFQPGKRGPGEPVVWSALEDWSTHINEDIRYFSGYAVYATDFTLTEIPQEQLYLDLGKVMIMARVKLNGKEVGGVWTAPYRLNITDYVEKGRNKLEIEVVNNWMNRLIGDQKLPEEERHTWTNVNPWKADSPLQPSGLLGPVVVEAYDYRIVK